VAVKKAYETVTEFEDWYERTSLDHRDGSLIVHNVSPCASHYWSEFENFKREHQTRIKNFHKYAMMADAEVVSRKPDLPNVSSGEVAGMTRRTARSVVQNTPNVEVICEFDDDSPKGILARYVLKTKIIGDELNSNEMQQNLFASTISSFTLGFDAVVPVLTQKADGSWCMDYDAIGYADVFPEPGVKDAQKSPTFYVRRYLTKNEVHGLIRNNVVGWHIPALKTLLKSNPPARQAESVSSEEKKSGQIPTGYEIITWYSNTGAPFLTFDALGKMLLRIEENRDPLKRHPVQVLVLERDPQQPLGKSQIALVYGRQEFQDLMLNGAMKQWYRNINPSLIGYGTGLNGTLNLSPGKFTNVPNPNAKIEAFEVSTQTLLMYGQIAQQNQGSMISLVGAADQQMAAAAGNGMSQTPQGVEAQEKMVDITTNNYQKAVEYFFSKYCSYALTVYFAEMKGTKKLVPSAETRAALINAGMPETEFDEDGSLKVDMAEMATTYHVRCIPGSLVELEDEKQLRILQEMLVPIAQAMPAFANTQNPQMLEAAAAAIQYILRKQIELSGSSSSGELAALFGGTTKPELAQQGERVEALEKQISGFATELSTNNENTNTLVLQLSEQMKQLTEVNQLLMQKLGVTTTPSVAA
jgi:hypothetical protein